MRYGIISDIHSNATALEAVLDRLKGVDAYISPGDVVGYGPDPNECCSMLRSIDCTTVIGNHDAVVADLVDSVWFNPYARAAAFYNREQLSPENLDFVGKLPVSKTFDDFILVHATLKIPLTFHYIHSPNTAGDCFEQMETASLCFVGHTHLAEAYIQRKGEKEVDQLSFRSGGKLMLKDDFQYIINCGSVGQPRDGNKGAACGIYDSEERSVEFIRVPYDIAAVQARMRDADLPDYLIERLEHGE